VTALPVLPATVVPVVPVTIDCTTVRDWASFGLQRAP